MGSHHLLQKFKSKLVTGLNRASIADAAEWACQYRVMGGKSFPGPWKFKYHPWLIDMHKSKTDINVGMKAAQMGFTEAMLNIVFYEMDLNNADALYILPSKIPDASDFSAARFDSALELSPHIADMYSEVRNIGHKKAGAANLYIRGSQSDAGLRSIPVSVLIADEVSVIREKALSLMIERLSGQLEKLIWLISTPTIEGVNIDREYKNSNQQHFYIDCPRCGKKEELTFPESLKITGEHINDPNIVNSHLICKNTGKELPHVVSDDPRKNADAKAEWLNTGKWVKGAPDVITNGFQISQLYSCTVTPTEIARAKFKADVNLTDEQELYNSKIGVTHAVKGSRIQDSELIECKGSHRLDERIPDGLKTMGIDVGTTCHIEIACWWFPSDYSPDLPERALARIILIEEDPNFAHFDKLMRQYNITHCVMDAEPEKRQASAFAYRHHGRVSLAKYARGISGKSIRPGQDEYDVQVHKAYWFDIALGRFKQKTISLPYDHPREYSAQIKAPTRVYERDADGHPVGRYPKTSAPDHYANARCYNEIALHLATNGSPNENINESTS